MLGDLNLLPLDVQEAMKRAEDLTEKNEKCKLNVCLCYNSKQEILRAVDIVSEKHSRGMIDEINVENFEKELYGGCNCKPDILIRTSNEVRLSNFLLY